MKLRNSERSCVGSIIRRKYQLYRRKTWNILIFRKLSNERRLYKMQLIIQGKFADLLALLSVRCVSMCELVTNFKIV